MPWVKFNALVADLCNGAHNFGADPLRMALSNVAPTANDATLTDIDQIGSAGGYAPATVTVTNSVQSGGVYTLAHDAVTFTATGADFEPFRYIVLYNDNNDKLIAWLDYGVSYTLPSGQPFTITANTVFDLA